MNISRSLRSARFIQPKLLALRVDGNSSYYVETTFHLRLPEPWLSVSVGQRLLQIRYQIPHPVSTGDVQKYHFCSICCGRGKLHAADANESCEPVLCHINAADVFYSYLVAVFHNEPCLNLDLAVCHYVELTCSFEADVNQDQYTGHTWSEQPRLAAGSEVKEDAESAEAEKQQCKKPGQEEVPVG